MAAHKVLFDRQIGKHLFAALIYLIFTVKFLSLQQATNLGLDVH